jgi:hypothetical protein
MNGYRNQNFEIIPEILIMHCVGGQISKPNSMNLAINIGIMYRRKTIQKMGMSEWVIIDKIVDLIILLISFA